MAAEKLDLEIVTPERLVVAETVDEVVLPAAGGYMGVLPGHAPLLTSLGVGELWYRTGNVTRYFAVSGGFAEVLRQRVSILAETCERAEEIDVIRARRAKERAEETLAREASEADFRRTMVSLQKAVIRIQVHGRGGP